MHSGIHCGNLATDLTSVSSLTVTFIILFVGFGSEIPTNEAVGFHAFTIRLTKISTLSSFA